MSRTSLFVLVIAVLSLLYTQFDVTNTLNDQLLENVRVEMEEAEGFSVLSYVPIAKLPYDKPGTTYTLVKMNDPNSVTGTFLNTLKFLVKDCDPNTGEPDDEVGYDDEYVVSKGYIILCDVYFRVPVNRGKHLCTTKIRGGEVEGGQRHKFTILDYGCNIILYTHTLVI